jgi:hypothetical protein
MKKYRLQSWKLQIDGEFDDSTAEETVIKELADRYMSISHCDPPGEHPIDLLTQKKYDENEIKRKLDLIGKSVGLFVYTEVFGINQWIQKYHLTIHPFKQNHWWESITENKFIFDECEFRYEIIKEEK